MAPGAVGPGSKLIQKSLPRRIKRSRLRQLRTSLETRARNTKGNKARTGLTAQTPRARTAGPSWALQPQRAEPGRAGPSRAEPSRADPGRAGPSRAGPCNLDRQPETAPRFKAEPGPSDPARVTADCDRSPPAAGRRSRSDRPPRALGRRYTPKGRERANTASACDMLCGEV